MKQTVFDMSLARLVQAGGGNAARLSCSGSTQNAGATEMTATMLTLKQCKTNIKNACTDPSGYNETEMNICKSAVETFKTEGLKSIY